MEALFSQTAAPLWGLALALALFYPVRQLIWTLYVRRAGRDTAVDEAESLRLKRRANVTSGLLCFVFAMLYANQMVQG